MELGLKGKVVAVTGGSEGIGRATVRRFVAEGAKVAFCARRKDALDALADEMRKAGGDVLAMTGDAGKSGGMERFIEATVIAFLASDAASYVTGCCINVDGGISGTL